MAIYIYTDLSRLLFMILREVARGSGFVTHSDELIVANSSWHNEQEVPYTPNSPFEFIVGF